MSRPWLEVMTPAAITVLATPEQVRVTRRGGSTAVEACAPGPAALSVPAALARCLPALSPDRKSWLPRPRVRILLSHHLAPLGLVPHARALQNREEREAAARHAFAAVHGAATADWHIVVDAGPGESALAAGLDGPLIDGLRRTVAEAGLALRSIEPLLSAAVSQARAALQGPAAWLVVAEPGRVVLARHEGGAWRSLRTHRPRRALADELGPWIDQARLIDGVEGPDQIIVTGTQAHDLAAFERPDWRVVQAPLVEAA